jgi:bacteriocin-like protein
VGFAISVEELQKTQAELSEEELEAVTGGILYEDNKLSVVEMACPNDYYISIQK